MSANGTGNRSRGSANELIIAALAAGKTNQEAADAAGVSPRTVSRRLSDPVFHQRILTVRGEMIKRALGRMANSMSSAADTLCKLLKAKSESVRLGACRAMLELGVKLRESVEFDARLAALESRNDDKAENE
jgi:hypothetical protein